MAQAETDPASGADAESDSKIFVSASLNTFGGIVDAHNGLATRLMKAEKQLEAAATEHGKAVAENLEQHEEIRSSQKQLLEESQKEYRDLHESIKTLLEERATSLEKQQEKAIRTLDDTLRPMIKAMERNIEDLVRGQAEWTGVTLPRWRADIGTDIQRLSSDLADHIGQWEDRATKQETQLDAAKSALEQNLTTKVEMLEGGIGALKEQCGTLGSELKSAEGRLQGAQDSLSEKLDSQGKRLEEQQLKQQETKDFVDKEKTRIGDLEHVVKEFDFERLNSAHRLGVDIDSLRDQLPPLKAWAQEQITTQLEKGLSDGLSAKADEINETLDKLHNLVATETQMLSTRLGAAESDNISLRVAIDNADKQCKATDTAVRAQLEEQGKMLEGQFNAEVDLVRSLLHLEGARLAKLEGSLSESNKELRDSSEKLANELGKMREQIQEATKQNTEQQISSRLKPVQQNLADLQDTLQEMSRTHGDRDSRLEELGEAMREVQDKVFSSTSGRYRNRSATSTAAGIPGTTRPASVAAAASFRFGGAASKPWDDGASTPATSEKQVDDVGAAQAHRPATSRPGSANFRRAYQQASGLGGGNDTAADLKSGGGWTSTASRQPHTARPATSRAAAPLGSTRSGGVAFGQSLPSHPGANFNRIPLQHCILR